MASRSGKLCDEEVMRYRAFETNLPSSADVKISLVKNSSHTVGLHVHGRLLIEWTPAFVLIVALFVGVYCGSCFH